MLRRVRSKPFLLCEYGHAMGNGPGALDRYDELVDAVPPAARRVHLGMAGPRAADAYAGRRGVLRLRRGLRRGGARRQLRDGRDGAAGRHPDAGSGRVRRGERPGDLRPRRRGGGGHQPSAHPVHYRVCGSSAGSRWTARPTVEQPLVDPGIEPGGSATLAQPASLRQAATEGETWLSVRAELAADEPWAPAGHVVARAQFRLRIGSAEPARPAWPSDPRGVPRAARSRSARRPSTPAPAG